MSHQLDQAKTKLARVDRLLKMSLVAFMVFMTVGFCFIAYQLFHLQDTLGVQNAETLKRQEQATLEARKRLATALDENARQHQITQQYVRCVSQILLKPIDQRQATDLDNCGDSVTSSGTVNNPEATSNNQQPTGRQEDASTSGAGDDGSGAGAQSQSQMVRPPITGWPLIDEILYSLGI